MKVFLHRAEQRGHVQHDWLESRHSFSFGSWYDPNYMGISALRVINDDQIAAHRGFGTHPHDNMEILTCVLSGTISHQDSMGNQGEIHAGEWQLMSAGTGVQHSEINLGDTPVRLLQIWMMPNIRNAEPNYQQIQCDPQTQPNQWHLIAGPTSDALMHLRQQLEVKTAYLTQGKQLDVTATQQLNYIHLIKGKLQIAEHVLTAGDAIAFDQVAKIEALEDSQMIWFDLPESI